MSGDPSGTMKNQNIFRSFVNKTYSFHRKNRLGIEHNHFTVNCFVQLRKAFETVWISKLQRKFIGRSLEKKTHKVA